MYEHPPDRLEYIIRFIFGAVAGLVIGFCLVMHDQPPATSTAVAELFAPAPILGALAAWQGDRFWRGLASLLGW